MSAKVDFFFNFGSTYRYLPILCMGARPALTPLANTPLESNHPCTEVLATAAQSN